MKTIDSKGITIYFSPLNEELAKQLSGKLPVMIQAITSTWGVRAPEKCRFYILDSMTDTIFHPAPLPRKIILALTSPLWFGKAYRSWKKSAGWTLNGQEERIFGVKSIYELEKAVKRNKNNIYQPLYNDLYARAEYTACHEMAHAFLSHLQLPLWLNEGIAQYTVDKYIKTPTIRKQTLEYILTDHENKPQNISHSLYEFLFGYWTVQYLEREKEGTIAEILKSKKDITDSLANALDIPESEFKKQMKTVLQNYYR